MMKINKVEKDSKNVTLLVTTYGRPNKNKYLAVMKQMLPRHKSTINCQVTWISI